MAERHDQAPPEADIGARQDDAVLADPGLATHDLLLWLAGRAPDALLARARNWLADGDLTDVATSLTQWLYTRDVEVPRSGRDLLAEQYIRAGRDPGVVRGLRLAEFDPEPYYAFQPSADQDEFGAPDELSELADPAELDPADRAVMDSVTDLAGSADVRGVWRAWRLPYDNASWPPPKRIYLVEVGVVRNAPTVAARVTTALARAGEADGQAEVFGIRAELPTYHRLALEHAKLIWAADQPGSPRVARVFDVPPVVDEDVVRFRDGHPRLPAAEAARVADYLDAGAPLLIADGLLADILDDERGAAVPVNVRTDGTWIWTDATTYYLRTHGIAPDPDLLAHISALEFAPTEPDTVAIQRALAILRDSSEDDADQGDAGQGDVGQDDVGVDDAGQDDADQGDAGAGDVARDDAGMGDVGQDNPSWDGAA